MPARATNISDLLRRMPPPSPALRREQVLNALANLATLGLASWQHWSLGALIWPYWIQSVAIGAFNAHRMWRLQRFTTDGLTMNDAPVAETARGKGCIVAFFCMHYGMFHFVYLIFLSAMARPTSEEWRWIGCGGALFVLTQLLNHRAQLAQDARGAPNIGTLMSLPYLRIVPIHLTIIFGLPFRGNHAAIWLFGILKSIADHFGIRAEDAVRRNAQLASVAAPNTPSAP